MGWFLPFVFILVWTKLRHQKHIILVFSRGVGYCTLIWGIKGTVWGRRGHLWILNGQKVVSDQLSKTPWDTMSWSGLCSKVVFNLMILALGTIKVSLRGERYFPLLSRTWSSFALERMFWGLFVSDSEKYSIISPTIRVTHFVLTCLFLQNELHHRLESTFLLPNHLFSGLS